MSDQTESVHPKILNILGTFGSAILLPIVLLIVGNGYTSAFKERELQGKFVELAVSILSQEPRPESRNLRDWATQVINQYSGVPLSPKTRQDLIENTPIYGSHFGSIAPVAEIQEMLKDLGYYSGSVDGQSGNELQAAIIKFQRENSLPADGLIGPRTLEKIQREAQRKAEQAKN